MSEPKRKLIYVSGPYTNGDQALNVYNAVRAALDIIKWGHAPYVPHLSHFIHCMSPQPYETWMRVDLAWVQVCQALVRLPGLSPGGDREVIHAIDHGVDVCYGMEDLYKWLTTTR